MSEITPFEFDGHQVRVQLDLDGNPWWVAKDVCDVLGYANASDAVKKHVRPGQTKTIAIRDGNRGNPNQVLINEGGLYRLVMRSAKDEAERFQDWVTDEVLPQVRQVGHYAGEDLSDWAHKQIQSITHIDRINQEQARHDREIVKQAKELLELHHAQVANTAAIADHDNRLDGIESHHDWFTALGYAKRAGIKDSSSGVLSRLGKMAVVIMKERGIEPGNVQDARFGGVNQYPLDVLDEAVRRLGW